METAIAVATTSDVSKSGIPSPLKFRLDVALTGRLGIELMPKDLPVSDLNIVKNPLVDYKKIRTIIADGDLYRLQSPYDQVNWESLMYVSKDKKQAVVFAFSIGYHKQGIFPILKLKGIDPSLMYSVAELNKVPHSFWGNDQVLNGGLLMKSGMELVITRPYDSVFLLEAR